MGRENRKSLALAGIFAALALLLEYSATFIPRMPQGGKFLSPGMIPILTFAILRGWRWGVLMGVGCGLLYYPLDPFFVHPAQFLLDYPVAFGAVGLAGIFKLDGGKLKIILAVFLGCLLRFLSHFISGIVFFKAFAPKASNPWIYSLVYNSTFMIPTLIVCFILVPPLVKLLSKIMLTDRD